MSAATRPRLGGLLACMPLLLLVAPLRHTLEGSMALHMLIELPMLFVAGGAAEGMLRHKSRLAGLAQRFDAYGLLGLALASCIAALWMIPSMLDLSLLDARVQGAKYLAWWLAGFVSCSSWRRAAPELAAFFLGNTAWMLATAGLLYQDAPQRLCVSYLQDEQVISGQGLVALSLLVGALAIARLVARPGQGVAPLTARSAPNAGFNPPSVCRAPRATRSAE
ncbi:MAG: hypothetical protein KF909_01005 [Rhodocyclaceae bacterium]|nr:hypothetical protein [Rhodocyclaceae bacterium]